LLEIAYCKFCSVLCSSNMPRLKYSSWRNCPPRAAVGKPSAIYGTHDHLILIMGRIADFAARDRDRKLKQVEANGGRWIPPKKGSSSVSSPPSQQQNPSNGANGHSTTTPPSSPSPPPFYGMAPLPTNIVMPPSYANIGFSTPNPSCSSSDDTSSDLSYQSEVALAEWNQMYQALQELEHHFGPAFQPLPADVQPIGMTPFGEAIHFASMEIACIWALYYSAHIVALRSHPDMSPYVMVAAGFSAPQTAWFAQQIGRIAAAMMPGELKHPLNPSIGATLCEVTIPLFVAGIQYKDRAQRDWLVRRARELEGLTAWASIGMIAQGCETAWTKTAAAGRGPPYVPSAEASSMTTSWERVGPSGTQVSEELRPPGAMDRLRHVYPERQGSVDEDSARSPGSVVEESGLRAQWAVGLLGGHLVDEVDK
jgi:Fungal specific transcription factor domain